MAVSRKLITALILLSAIAPIFAITYPQTQVNVSLPAEGQILDDNEYTFVVWNIEQNLSNTMCSLVLDGGLVAMSNSTHFNWTLTNSSMTTDKTHSVYATCTGTTNAIEYTNISTTTTFHTKLALAHYTDELSNALVGTLAATTQTIATMFEWLRDNAGASLGGIMMIIILGVGISKVTTKGSNIRGQFGK